MNDRLLVATRKGLFVLHADGNGRWTLGDPHFAGEPVGMTLADPRDGTLYAALNLGHFGVKLHRRRAGAAEWEECAVPVYPPQPADAPRPNGDAHASAAADPDGNAASPAPPQPPWTLQQIWSLEAGGADEPGVLWAGTIPGGLFRSDDGGDSWLLNRALWDRPERPEWFGGGYDAPGIHSVMVDPRDSRHVTVGISCGGVWQTDDGGASWRVTADGMEADYMPPERRGEANVQDPHRVVQCAAAPDVLWTQHHCAIFRSTDGGARWQRIEAQPSSFGFAVAVHPHDPDTAWFVPAVKDACRIPVNGEFVVTRTRDGGRSFERLSNGLPPAPAYDLVYRHGLAVDDSGTRLAMASTTGALWTSDDGGDRWQLVSAHLPPVYCVRFA
ncbi:TPA: exo-alpha-sialidase [Burkholderia multivorans]|uniref:WD40/YVTN/BNR-like repeat-containing protein n=1 Tax=Burkholderia multivorans TaxID=87883 RepID=UPI001C210A3F|nr:exo-alpha-sialidase [Burkholderia multivorans]MBU9352171.1 exo-alpha-sialidase [Burkholderia multivorans]MBU9395794.1 exo-alpha-sialidase [Burkholderia multivorans]HDR9835799.1 exo-alpha-sialidase [Burkholderia multivorans]HDR9841785.1 exo-alpha-sialidase [Burkholderia multivorans]HDR9846949.1 exo-alpha-sialidase [Burkholderia multivorans]